MVFFDSGYSFIVLDFIFFYVRVLLFVCRVRSFLVIVFCNGCLGGVGFGVVEGTKEVFVFILICRFKGVFD